MARLYGVSFLPLLSFFFFFFFFFSTLLLSNDVLSQSTSSPSVTLLTNWTMVSSAHLLPSISIGEELSQPDYVPTNASSWYNVSVPTTVLAGLIANGLYTDPFYGLNLQDIDSNLFSTSWWFRTEFQLDASSSDPPIGSVRLRFKGVNYKANLWFNGVLIANETKMMGTFRYFEFAILPFLSSSTFTNALALEIFKPIDLVFPPDNNSTDLALTFVDWAPPPPDANMGIWQDVELLITSAPISLAYPLVTTILHSDTIVNPSNFSKHYDVELVVTFEVTNWNLEDEISVTLSIFTAIPSPLTAELVVIIPPNTTVEIFQSLSSRIFLNSFWWPWQMGTQTQWTLSVNASVPLPGGPNGTLLLSDTLTTLFGIRVMDSKLLDNGNRVFTVNGNPILIRGAGWAPDLFLRTTPQRQLR
jgi:exo-1,4-beta-D-glucosaminidase